MARRRLDVLIVERGLVPSRERARSSILAGDVRVGDSVVTKAGEMVDEDAVIHVIERARFVSRGGEKLSGALEKFGLEVSGRRAIDVGASTGGFTDCLLQNGAASVVAVDVGYGQLAWSLRTDDRVTVVERTNIRSADPVALGAPFELAVVDVSFISLRTVMDRLVELLGPDADIIMLVKPQFEAGKNRVGKRGVVKDASVHADVLETVARSARDAGLVVRGVSYSPITGPEGNIEFWLWASRGGREADVAIDPIVDEAHRVLGG